MVIEKGEVEPLLKDLPVSKLFGIGPKLERELQAIGIFTCGQLGKSPVAVLNKRFGVIGKRLHEMGLGLDDSPVVPFEEEEDAKSISHSVTLEEDTSDPLVLRKVLSQLSEKVSKRMRRGFVLLPPGHAYGPLFRFLHLHKTEDPVPAHQQRE